VVLSARRVQLLDELAAEIAEKGGSAMPVVCDVAELDEVRELHRRTMEAFGRADVLVNNAGVPGGGAFADLTVEQVERIVRVNFLGVLYGTKVFLPDMLEAGRGHVVNVASLAGRFAVPGSAVYSGTKHAVVAFCESLNYEVAPRGVKVTAVNPGLVETETFPHRDAIDQGRRVLQPDAVAELIVRVVERGIAPERSIPRVLAAMQLFRVLTPRLYRWGVRQAVQRGMRATRAGEAGH